MLGRVRPLDAYPILSLGLLPRRRISDISPRDIHLVGGGSRLLDMGARTLDGQATLGLVGGVAVCRVRALRMSNRADCHGAPIHF